MKEASNLATARILEQESPPPPSPALAPTLLQSFICYLVAAWWLCARCLPATRSSHRPARTGACVLIYWSCTFYMCECLCWIWMLDPAGWMLLDRLAACCVSHLQMPR